MNRWMLFAERGLIRLNQPPVDGGDSATPPPSGATFTQEDLTRIAAAESDKGERRGKQKALEEVTQALGGLTLEEAAQIIKDQKTAEDAAKTQVQRDLEAAAQAKAEAAAEREAAQVERHEARVFRALTLAGVDEKALAAITVPGITIGSTPEEIQTAVDKLKTDIPSLFGKATPQTPTADPARPGATGGLQNPAAGSLGEDGKKRFEARFGKRES